MNGDTTIFAHRAFVCMVILCALAFPSWGQEIEHKLLPSDGATLDYFGRSVAISGDFAIIGAAQDDDLGDASGSAYVYQRQNDESWIEVAKLIASDGAPGDVFGRSVSLYGDQALIGAPHANENGAAYFFERTTNGTWVEVAKVAASDGAFEDRFGDSVALLDNMAIIGAPVDDGTSTDSGSAYVFERLFDGSWIEVQKLTASDGGKREHFGSSVSITEQFAAVSAFSDDDMGALSGSAYVFEREANGFWIEMDKLTASDGTENDFFGGSISVSGERALIGAWATGDHGANSGSVYVFERQENRSWLETQELTASDAAPFHLFGRSVSLVGERGVIGADAEISFESGRAYVFDRTQDGSWIEVGKLTASDEHSADQFGISISFSGSHVLIGAPQNDDLGDKSGSAYVFENVFPVASEPTADLPDSYRLSEVYPNPFNPQTQFSLEIAQHENVQIEVYNTLGQNVQVLHDELLSGPATHSFTFEAGSLPSGVYLLRVTGESFSATRTMTLLK